MLKIWFKIFFRNGQKNWLNISINIIGLTVYFAQLLLVLLSFNGEQILSEARAERQQMEEDAIRSLQPLTYNFIG